MGPGGKLGAMDKITSPSTPIPSSTARLPREPIPPRPSAGVDGEGLAAYRSTSHWAEQPSAMRKFAPLVVIFVIAAGALVAMNYKFSGEESTVDAPLARGPAVESLVENAPTAAGPADAASATVDSSVTTPAVESPAPTPAPTTAPAREPAPPPATSQQRPTRSVPLPKPNDNETVRPPQPDQPSRLPEPEVIQPNRITPPMPSLQVPTPLPVPAPAEPMPQPPVVEPAPVPPLPTPEGGSNPSQPPAN